MDKIVVIGGGGHAKVVISVIKKLSCYDLIGYIDPYVKTDLLGIKNIGDDSILTKLFRNKKVKLASLGIGQLNESKKREKVIANVSSIGFKFPPIVSPNAIINEDVEIGEGTIIMDGVVIQAGTRIGNFSIINTNATIDHDCVVGDLTHIGPGASISGGVKIGNKIFIGAGVTIIQYKTIVDNINVGAGSTVLDDLYEIGTYVGTPVRQIKHGSKN